jgi:hypothetical protein
MASSTKQSAFANIVGVAVIVVLVLAAVVLLVDRAPECDGILHPITRMSVDPVTGEAEYEHVGDRCIRE